MKPEQIEELKKLSGAATPGEWIVIPGVCVHDHPETSADVRDERGDFVANCGCDDKAPPHARLIAAARNALPTLLREREQLIDHLRSFIHTDCVEPNRPCSACTSHLDALAAAES